MMNRPPVIPVTQLQLNQLLNDEEKQNYQFLIEKGVFCAQCSKMATKGMEVDEIKLDSLNDLLVHGTCKVCHGKVARTIEFGDNAEFYAKAMKFRKG